MGKRTETRLEATKKCWEDTYNMCSSGVKGHEREKGHHLRRPWGSRVHGMSRFELEPAGRDKRGFLMPDCDI